jgi:hypothetical protein
LSRSVFRGKWTLEKTRHGVQSVVHRFRLRPVGCSKYQEKLYSYRRKLEVVLVGKRFNLGKEFPLSFESIHLRTASAQRYSVRCPVALSQTFTQTFTQPLRKPLRKPFTQTFTFSEPMHISARCGTNHIYFNDLHKNRADRKKTNAHYYPVILAS